jgi:hypothetical protein
VRLERRRRVARRCPPPPRTARRSAAPGRRGNDPLASPSTVRSENPSSFASPRGRSETDARRTSTAPWPSRPIDSGREPKSPRRSSNCPVEPSPSVRRTRSAERGPAIPTGKPGIPRCPRASVSVRRRPDPRSAPKPAAPPRPTGVHTHRGRPRIGRPASVEILERTPEYAVTEVRYDQSKPRGAVIDSATG